ncbi:MULTISPECIES: DUF4262 domain-containing protein [unclassified Achromobacter]|uniref:DUF4262 domain-containing protein n=1 Tax=unclassified Achromobacter TaxID=2626865 RepID=UPI000B5187CE|nr:MULTISPECIES: DUF4262 domain-containing protein [unclassified Achromobacter]OWT80049.1 hypothetical protein CEY05_01050 [Achromobacter sp. HZ34]OWT81932.1 hypothetical protein CEY04_01050 [Achromobacter sp. HZ28]
MPKNPDLATALDAPASALDADEQRFVEQIRDKGWFHTAVFADDEGPGFSYTTGLWVNHGFPEILVFALRQETAHAVLGGIYDDIAAGKPPPVGAITDTIFKNGPALLLPMAKSHYADYLGWNLWFHGNADFPCLQLFWPDKAGLLPGQPGADESLHALQPVLTEPADGSH